MGPDCRAHEDPPFFAADDAEQLRPPLPILAVEPRPEHQLPAFPGHAANWHAHPLPGELGVGGPARVEKFALRKRTGDRILAPHDPLAHEARGDVIRRMRRRLLLQIAEPGDDWMNVLQALLCHTGSSRL